MMNIDAQEFIAKRRLRQNGKGRPSRFTPDEVKQITELVYEGWSIAEIAAFMKAPHGTVSGYVYKARESMK